MNISKLSKLLLVLVSVLFASCEVEPLDASLLSLANSSNNNQTATSDYWPTALNNTWNYAQNGGAASPMKIISTEVIDGKTYYKFDNVFGQTAGAGANVTLMLRKSNGDYFMRMPGFTVDYGGGITANASTVEYLLFKDYVAANGTWTSTYNQVFTFNNPIIPTTTMVVVNNGKMLERDITYVVNGVTFNNVIKFEVVQNYSGSGQSGSNTTTYWFAKNVGCIKSETISATSTTTTELMSYTLN